MTISKQKKNQLPTNELEGMITLANSMEDGLCLISQDFKMAFANTALQKIFGPWEGKSCYAYFHCREEPCTGCRNKEVFQGKTVRWEWFSPTNQRTYDLMDTPIKSPNGTMYKLETFRDVTERKRAEEAIKKAQKKYDLLFNNMANGFAYCKMLFDTKGKAVDFVYLQINYMFEKITGLKSDVVVGRKVTEAIPGIKEATPELFSIYGRVAQTGIPEKFEINFTPLNKWLYISVYSPEKGYFAAVFEDISERKKAEQAVERKREERLRVYLESTPSAVFVANAEGKYLFVNQSACNLLGYSKEELLSMSISQVLSNDYLNAGLEQFALLKRTGRSRREVCLKRKDGSEVDVILTAAKLPDGNFIANCEDLTDRKELEKQLQAKENLAAIGQTAGMVGHDIRNPLQAMTADLYLIKEELKTETADKQAITESIEEIQQNIDYVNKIVADLQDFTRPIMPNKKDIKVEVLVGAVVAAVKVPQTIQTHILVSPELTIKTDPDYLKRILSNLVLNAIQAMPSGGTLDIQVTKNENKALITVQDTGIGIPNDAKKELFKPLFTTKAKGQGLGLAVVKRMTEALDGTITFESEEGKGTKFTIELTSN